MTGPKVEIENMVLSIPGLGFDEAHVVSRNIMDRVAKTLPNKLPNRQYGALDVRITIPEGTPKEQLSKLIAKQILGSLK